MRRRSHACMSHGATRLRCARLPSARSAQTAGPLGTFIACALPPGWKRHSSAASTSRIPFSAPRITPTLPTHQSPLRSPQSPDPRHSSNPPSAVRSRPPLPTHQSPSAVRSGPFSPHSSIPLRSPQSPDPRHSSIPLRSPQSPDSPHSPLRLPSRQVSSSLFHIKSGPLACAHFAYSLHSRSALLHSAHKPAPFPPPTTTALRAMLAPALNGLVVGGACCADLGAGRALLVSQHNARWN